MAAARRAGVALMVGHVERFNPAVETIKDAIRGEDILSISITRVGPFPPRMSNVGVVIDLAVHDIDLIRWFTDSEIEDVQPLTASAVAEREDIALLQFRTTSGVLAQINTNWLTPFKARTVHVATRNKYIIGDLLTRQVTECFGFQPDGSYSMRHLSVGYTEPLRAELVAFFTAIREGERAGGERRGRRRQPGNRHALPRGARRPAPHRKRQERVAAECAGCTARCGRLAAGGGHDQSHPHRRRLHARLAPHRLRARHRAGGACSAPARLPMRSSSPCGCPIISARSSPRAPSMRRSCRPMRASASSRARDAVRLFADRVFTLLVITQIVLLALALVFMPQVVAALAPGFRRRPGPFRARRRAHPHHLSLPDADGAGDAL